MDLAPDPEENTLLNFQRLRWIHIDADVGGGNDGPAGGEEVDGDVAKQRLAVSSKYGLLFAGGEIVNPFFFLTLCRS